MNTQLVIGVLGSPSNRVTKNIIEAVEFYAERLLPDEIINELDIDVEFVDDEDYAGHCLCIDGGEDPREFLITIDRNRTRDSIYSILAHEMVHVKQYALNEHYRTLTLENDVLGYNKIWKGKVVVNDDYYNCPWEVEAFGLEVGLYNAWKNRKKSG